MNNSGYKNYMDVSEEINVELTKRYSTSFSIGIRLFKKDYRKPICAIYGFVRLADEIVDSFNKHDQKKLLEEFTLDTLKAIENRISLNPVLHAFQHTVHNYQISTELILAFLKSMEMDLTMKRFNREEYAEYIYGSAEAVGLMCLTVFTYPRKEVYHELQYYARSLGAAFQKVNFLRDFESDYKDRGRIYFPDVDYHSFDDRKKAQIEMEITQDFIKGLEGIKKLPESVRLGVYIAYIYFRMLLKKIHSNKAVHILENRIRISNRNKFLLFLKSFLHYKLGQIQ